MTVRKPLVEISGVTQELPAADTLPTMAPAAHAASHAAGQADAITPAAIGAATAAQGTTADSALQPSSVGSGLTGLPTSPGGRLTLESGVPVSVTDQAAKTVLYYTPYVHDQLFLYTSSLVKRYTFAELSLAGPSLTAGKNYDVFVYDNGGTLTLELSAAWTNDTTRADALAWQAGLGWVKSAAHSRFWLGTIRASATDKMADVGGSAATAATRFVSNVYNQVPRFLHCCPGYVDNNAWTTYSTASTSWTLANGGTGALIGFVTAVPTTGWATMSHSSDSPSGNYCNVGIGLDSQTSAAAMNGAGTAGQSLRSQSNSAPFTVAAGYHYLALLILVSGGTGTYYADGARYGAAADSYQTRISGWVLQ